MTSGSTRSPGPSGPEARWWSPFRKAEGGVILHVDLGPDPEREARAFGLLDVDEKSRCAGFVEDDARRRFTLCRAALRLGLARRLGCSNRDLSFGYRKHGKPYARVNGSRVAASFNVSHSGPHGLIAFSEHGGLGVDVEERVLRRDFEDLGEAVLGPRERKALTALRGRDQAHLFFRIWTMKEALIKALATGFSLNPARFEVPPAMLRGARAGVLRLPPDPSRRWRLLDLGAPRFAAAVAWRLPHSKAGAGGGPPRRPRRGTPGDAPARDERRGVPHAAASRRRTPARDLPGNRCARVRRFGRSSYRKRFRAGVRPYPPGHADERRCGGPAGAPAVRGFTPMPVNPAG